MSEVHVCMQVLQSMLACFQYDTVNFLDEERFKLLMPPLVSQLNAEPPAGLLPALAVELQSSALPVDETPPKAPGAEAALQQQHAYARVAMAALIEMAVASGSDAVWKPLSHQVCFSLQLSHWIPLDKQWPYAAREVPELGVESVCGSHGEANYQRILCQGCI